jgi:hypothetical protein
MVDPSQELQRLLKVIEGLGSPDLMDGGRHSTFPEGNLQGLPNPGGAMGLDFHGSLLGFQDGEKNENQDESLAMLSSAKTINA